MAAPDDTASPSTLSRAWTWTLRSVGLSSSPPPPPSTPQQQEPEPEPHSQPTSTIHVSPEVYKNPYHPLPGPPQTPSEKSQLTDQIKTERDAVQTSLSRRLDPTAIETAAKSNCADLAWAYQMCLRNGSVRERM